MLNSLKKIDKYLYWETTIIINLHNHNLCKVSNNIYSDINYKNYDLRNKDHLREIIKITNRKIHNTQKMANEDWEYRTAACDLYSFEGVEFNE